MAVCAVTVACTDPVDRVKPGLDNPSPTPAGDVEPTPPPPGPTPPPPIGDPGTVEDRVNRFVKLLAVEPPDGPAIGGTELRFVGEGFAPGTVVRFGGAVAPSVFVVNEHEMTVVSPPDPAADGIAARTVTIEVENPSGIGRLEDAFTWRTRLTVQSIEPERLPEEGGERATVRGTGFPADARVYYGGREALEVEVHSPTELSFSSPVCFSGPQALEVAGTEASARLSEDVWCYHPLVLTGVLPGHGPTGGGTVATLSGEGLLPDSEVWFGELPAEVRPTGDDQERDRLEVVVPESRRAGPVPVRVVNRNGELTLEGGWVYFEPLALVQASPTLLPAEGGVPMTLKGTGFDDDMLLTVGGRAATLTHVERSDDPAALDWAEAIAPPGSPGRADVRVQRSFGDAVLPGAVRYAEPAGQLRVTPAHGPVEGGLRVEISVDGLAQFPATESILFGGRQARLFGVDGATAWVLAPESPLGGPGAVDVEIDAPGLYIRAPGAFVYRRREAAAPLLYGLTPSVASTAGGDEIRLVGVGFDRGRVDGVRFGGVPALEFFPRGAHEVFAVVPPAERPGSVDVELRLSTGTLQLNDALEYRQSLRILAVRPERGPAFENAEITVVAEGLQGELSISLGGAPAERILGRTVASVSFIAAPAPPGPADLIIRRDDGATARLPGAYVFTEPLTLDAVTPAAGAVAGGTQLLLRGAGFTPTSVVRIDGEEVAYEFLDARTLRLRTLPHAAGEAEISVDQAGSRAARPFLYFDPANRRGGTSGGPIDGSINVTVLDRVTRQPISDAQVVIGPFNPGYPDLRLNGVTDVNGQVTFSEIGLRGPTQVSAMRSGWAAYSVVAFDAANITVRLRRTELPPPTPGNPGGDSPDVPGPAILRGRVLGVDPKFFPLPSEREGKRLLIKVRSTTRSVFSRNPEPGDLADLRAEGSYELISRPGDQAIYAVAGLEDTETGEFTPYLMGIRAFVFVRPDELLEEQDIYLRIPMDARATVDMSLAPGGEHDPEGPQRFRVDANVDLTPYGYISQLEGTRVEGETRMLEMERLPRLDLAELGDLEADLGLTSRAMVGFGFPYAQSYMFNVEPEPGTPIVAEPWVDIGRPLHPTQGGTLGPQLTISFDAPCCSTPAYNRLFFSNSRGKTLWEVIVAGDVKAFELPELSLVSDLRPMPAGELVRWSLTRVYKRRPFDIDHYTASELGGTWLSFSISSHSFTR